MGAAIALRALAWSRAGALFSDGPTFLGLARLAAEGQWSALLAHPYHPLYALAIAGLHGLSGGFGGFDGFEGAAVAVSALSGGASVAFLYVWLKDAFDRDVARVGAWLLALHPHAIAFSSDVQSDGLYLALFLAGVALLWRALDSGRPGVAAPAGAASGLAYLARPEGLGLAVFAGVVGLTRLASGRGSRRRGAAWLAALTAGFGLLFVPYAWALRSHTGVWALTQKKGLSELTGIGPERPHADRADRIDPALAASLIAEHPFLETVLNGPRRTAPSRALAPPAPAATGLQRHLVAFDELQEELSGALRPALCVLLALGILARRGRPGPVGRFVLALVSLYLALLYALSYGAGYVSERHTLPVVVLLFGYVSLGVSRAGAVALTLARRRLDGWSPRAAVGVGMALTLIALAPEALRERRSERAPSRLAAEWLRGDPERGGVAAPRQRVAYYADAPYVFLPWLPESAIVDALRAAGARHLIVDDARLGEDPALRAASAALQLVHRVRGTTRDAYVFALDPPADPTTGGR